MSNYVGIGLTFDRQEDAEKVAARAKEIQAEVNSEEGTKVEFELFNHEDGHTLSIETLSKYVDEIDLGFDVANQIAASFPEMKMRFYMTWEGPIVMEAVSKNGSLYTLERFRDENGFFLADDGENSLLIEPEDWGFYEIKGGEGIVPEGTTKIEDFGFWHSGALKSVVIPPSVTEIGRFAFARCPGLECVVIPDSVTTIGEGAFEGCTGLETISLPDSVNEIGMAAFEGCSKLASVAIPSSLGRIAPFAFSACASLTTIEIPESVHVIERCAFSECRGLTHAVIHSSIIKVSAFEDCSSLRSVEFGPSVSEIQVAAFIHTALSEDDLPEHARVKPKDDNENENVYERPEDWEDDDLPF